MTHEARSPAQRMAGKTIAAMEYHSERVRERAGELVPIVRHEEILGAAVDHHHKSKSLLGSNLPRKHHVSEVRAQNTPVYQEVDDFDDSDEEEDQDGGDEGNGDLLRIGGGAGNSGEQPRSQQSSLLLGLASGGSARKLNLTSAELDPVDVLRRMRSQTALRANSSSHSTLEAVKRAGCAPPLLDDEDLDDADISLHRELTSVRSKSFLARPELQSGAADDMLAQIRGAKWQSDSITGSRSNKSMTFRGDSSSKGGDSILRSESMLKPSSGGGGSMGPSLPSSPAGVNKSFSAGKRSGALPGVSVDSTPSSSLANEQDSSMRSSSRQVPATTRPDGLFSKLKHMMK